MFEWIQKSCSAWSILFEVKNNSEHFFLNQSYLILLFGHYSWCSGLNKHKIKMKKKELPSLSAASFRLFFAKSVNFFARGIESTKLSFKYNTQSALLVMVCDSLVFCVSFFLNLVVVNIQIKFFGSHYYSVGVFDLMTIDRESWNEMFRSKKQQRKKLWWNNDLRTKKIDSNTPNRFRNIWVFFANLINNTHARSVSFWIFTG